MSPNSSSNETVSEPNSQLDSDQQAIRPETLEPLTEIDQLKQEIEQLQKAQQAISDQYLRAKAEAENARRRADEEISKARKFALESFAESLLPVVDSLEAALALPEPSANQLVEGSEATLRQLLSALERNKMSPIAPDAGAKFDPHLHQAISMVASDLPSNSVVSVLQKGYTIADRVLRPALVTVSAAS